MLNSIFALARTAVGFVLGWCKEIIHNRLKVYLCLKDSNSLCYIEEKCNDNGNISEKRASIFVANKISLTINT